MDIVMIVPIRQIHITKRIGRIFGNAKDYAPGITVVRTILVTDADRGTIDAHMAAHLVIPIFFVGT